LQNDGESGRAKFAFLGKFLEDSGRRRRKDSVQSEFNAPRYMASQLPFRPLNDQNGLNLLGQQFFCVTLDLATQIRKMLLIGSGRDFLDGLTEFSGRREEFLRQLFQVFVKLVHKTQDTVRQRSWEYGRRWASGRSHRRFMVSKDRGG
jgi:hypothetical protein